MALQLLTANNAQSVLAAGISASATSLTLNTGTGALFPSPVSGTSFFKLTLIDAATGQLSEIVHVTAKSGDVLTIVRGQEGTTARAWSANDIAANMLTAGTILLLAQLESPSFTGTPTGPTASTGTNTTQLATTAFVKAAITALGLGTASTRNVGTGSGQIPDMSSFASGSTSTSFWYKFPNGMVMMGGNATGITGGSTGNAVFFPIPFPNACSSVMPSLVNPGLYGSTPVAFNVNIDNTSRFSVYTSNTASAMTIYWLAFGS
ncbi:gp53-like domain-containing protein [Enterobacter asburiae]|uniref:gp53-like domain-containing protein n=1 Tax=Enterobacter asburiae TaxID=61645 RepID=UPI00402A6984